MAEHVAVGQAALDFELTDVRGRTVSLICLAVALLLSACGTSQAEIRLEANGSGDYSTLEEAVERAPEGGTIILAPGTYRLAKPLDISKPLRLVGAEMDQTEIVSEAEGYVVRFSGDGPFAAEDITFRYEGTAVADVVVVEGGKIAFARCRFTRAVWTEREKYRAGLRLRGNTTGVMRECEVVENSSAGIIVEDRAQPTLEGNVCTDNEVFGIIYWGVSSGVARQNECSRNGTSIFVMDQAQPTLEGNVCTDNKGYGIVYRGDASGAARQNECSRNGWHGIYVADQAQPTLQGNVCIGNEWDGIAYEDNAGGVARQNECSENRGGIGVLGQAQPTLEGNVCTDNRVVGIGYGGNTHGVARQNECSRNGEFGILVIDQAQPTLQGNVCTNNEQIGIAYTGNTGGVARQNECSGNEVGIHVAKTAAPDLLDNKCHDNTEEDIRDLRP